jgi:hypothetical protein
MRYYLKWRNIPKTRPRGESYNEEEQNPSTEGW